MSYIESLAHLSRSEIVDRAAEVGKERTTLDDHEDGTINDKRALKGQAAVMVGSPDFALGKNGIFTDISDALGNIAHFCHRAGIDPETVFEHGLRGAVGDLEDGDEAQRDDFNFPEESH